MKNQDKSNPLLKGAASLARKVAQNEISAACWVFYNQPKEPENMAARLQRMK
ncbi:MAG: cyclic lactone autoinducer peptide [Lachnospiraceae bacterium]|nr:cyclic lactone autoinducer peptide [Lachnospiraceae bacterium]